MTWRKKVLIVPYLRCQDTIYVLMFQDTKTKEWTFNGGGVKKNESFFESAQREMREESNNTCSVTQNYRTITFTTRYRPPQLRKNDRYRKVTSFYTIFFYEMSPSSHDIRHAYMNAPIKNEETMDVRLFPLSDLIRKKHLFWTFIADIVAPHVFYFFHYV